MIPTHCSEQNSLPLYTMSLVDIDHLYRQEALPEESTGAIAPLQLGNCWPSAGSYVD